MPTYDILIIGGGPAGATAALYTSRAELKTVVLDMSINSGALGITSKIANYPGIKEVLSGEELLKRMWEHAGLYGAEFKKEKVVAVDFSTDDKMVTTAQGNTYVARAVILATGAMGRSSVLPGEQELLGRGVSYCATCDGAFFKGKNVAVYGSGDYAYEEAAFLGRFARTVHFISPKGIEKERLPERAVLHPETRITHILGDKNVSGIKITGKEGAGEWPVDGVFIYTSGNRPVVAYLQGGVSTTEKSCIVVDSEFRTNMPGVFACGDVLCNQVQQAVVAAAQGCVAALSADKYVHGRKAFARDYN